MTEDYYSGEPVFYTNWSLELHASCRQESWYEIFKDDLQDYIHRAFPLGDWRNPCDSEPHDDESPYCPSEEELFSGGYLTRVFTNINYNENLVVRASCSHEEYSSSWDAALLGERGFSLEGGWDFFFENYEESNGCLESLVPKSKELQPIFVTKNVVSHGGKLKFCCEVIDCKPSYLLDTGWPIKFFDLDFFEIKPLLEKHKIESSDGFSKNCIIYADADEVQWSCFRKSIWRLLDRKVDLHISNIKRDLPGNSIPAPSFEDEDGCSIH